MAIDDAYKSKKTGLTAQNWTDSPFLWMSGKSEKVEPSGRVYFPLPDLSRKIERDSARRVVEDVKVW